MVSQRSDFDLTIIRMLLDVLTKTSSGSFCHIHGKAKNELIAIDRGLAQRSSAPLVQGNPWQRARGG